MAKDEKTPERFWDDLPAREEMRERLDHYLDLPLALASVVVVLLVVIQLTGEVSPQWESRIEALSWTVWGLFLVEFVAKFALAPVKRSYLRKNWLDVLILLLPFLRLLRVLRVLRAARGFPIFRLLVFGGRGSSSTLTLLKRRRLGQLALVSAMVVLIAAALAFLLEEGAPGGNIETFGDALWWSAALVTTVSSELYPVTVGGRILAFLMMLYALGVFSYFIASIASVLVESDARQSNKEKPEKESIELNKREVAALRSILEKADK
ncbi:potassium channel family protein [Rubrobacter indicoceani]|uniref:potassium channel family protein n=1 Tax=Rubrobacter indicoceani TaxID=2051957 RepID=UPI000E5A233E|nr:potassium channel family protein [Rubrobacter indicoceani]